MRYAKEIRLASLVGLAALFSGCATLDITSRKELTPVVEKQGVTLGVQALGDRLTETINDPQSSIITASGQLFDKVILLPKESRFMKSQEIQAANGVDYILSLGIADISVEAGLNPIWFASFPLLFFKIYTPIVTFQPGVAIDVTLREARTGSVLIQKQIIEGSSDHYAPSDVGPKVRKLVSLTINNALVLAMRESQQSIATARQGKK